MTNPKRIPTTKLIGGVPYKLMTDRTGTDYYYDEATGKLQDLSGNIFYTRRPSQKNPNMQVSPNQALERNPELELSAQHMGQDLLGMDYGAHQEMMKADRYPENIYEGIKKAKIQYIEPGTDAYHAANNALWNKQINNLIDLGASQKEISVAQRRRDASMPHPGLQSVDQAIAKAELYGPGSQTAEAKQLEYRLRTDDPKANLYMGQWKKNAADEWEVQALGPQEARNRISATNQPIYVLAEDKRFISKSPGEMTQQDIRPEIQAKVPQAQQAQAEYDQRRKEWEMGAKHKLVQQSYDIDPNVDVTRKQFMTTDQLMSVLNREMAGSNKSPESIMMGGKKYADAAEREAYIGGVDEDIFDEEEVGIGRGDDLWVVDDEQISTPREVSGADMYYQIGTNKIALTPDLMKKADVYRNDQGVFAPQAADEVVLKFDERGFPVEIQNQADWQRSYMDASQLLSPTPQYATPNKGRPEQYGDASKVKVVRLQGTEANYAPLNYAVDSSGKPMLTTLPASADAKVRPGKERWTVAGEAQDQTALISQAEAARDAEIATETAKRAKILSELEVPAAATMTPSVETGVAQDYIGNRNKAAKPTGLYVPDAESLDYSPMTVPSRPGIKTVDEKQLSKNLGNSVFIFPERSLQTGDISYQLPESVNPLTPSATVLIEKGPQTRVERSDPRYQRYMNLAPGEPLPDDLKGFMEVDNNPDDVLTGEADALTEMNRRADASKTARRSATELRQRGLITEADQVEAYANLIDADVESAKQALGFGYTAENSKTVGAPVNVRGASTKQAATEAMIAKELETYDKGQQALATQRAEEAAQVDIPGTPQWKRQQLQNAQRNLNAAKQQDSWRAKEFALAAMGQQDDLAVVKQMEAAKKYQVVGDADRGIGYLQQSSSPVKPTQVYTPEEINKIKQGRALQGAGRGLVTDLGDVSEKLFVDPDRVISEPGEAEVTMLPDKTQIKNASYAAQDSKPAMPEYLRKVPYKTEQQPGVTPATPQPKVQPPQKVLTEKSTGGNVNKAEQFENRNRKMTDVSVYRQSLVDAKYSKQEIDNDPKLKELQRRVRDPEFIHESLTPNKTVVVLADAGNEAYDEMTDYDRAMSQGMKGYSTVDTSENYFDDTPMEGPPPDMAVTRKTTSKPKTVILDEALTGQSAPVVFEEGQQPISREQAYRTTEVEMGGPTRVLNEATETPAAKQALKEAYENEVKRRASEGLSVKGVSQGWDVGGRKLSPWVVVPSIIGGTIVGSRVVDSIFGQDEEQAREEAYMRAAMRRY